MAPLPNYLHSGWGGLSGFILSSLFCFLFNVYNFHAQNTAFGMHRPAKKNWPDNKIGNKSTNLIFNQQEIIFRLNEFSGGDFQ
jgi:hypothetical protein